jgi:diguanylate cyclase (GGDEF)-like protein
VNATVVQALAVAAGPVAAGWPLHARLLRRRLAAARRDPLTGLPTRGEFERRAARLAGRGPVLVVLLDLDGFKQLNDTHGHAAGDDALWETAVWLREWNASLFGGRGVVARLGGDEFAAVVPATGAGDSGEVLAALHAWVTLPFPLDGRTLAVGASVGGCWSPVAAPGGLPVLLRQADEAMYAAKRDGGGARLVTAAGVPVSPPVVNGRRPGRRGTTTVSGGVSWKR